MKEQRQYKRINREETCILQLRDWYYPATVKNSSFGGVCLYLHQPLPGLHVGDNCNLSMNGEHSREHSCEVVRIEIPNIALKFSDRYKVK